MNHKFKAGDVITSITSFKSTLEIVCIDEEDRYVTRYPGYNNTLTDSQKWVEDNYRLVSENMENTIEVGDTIGSLKFLEGTQGVVNCIANDKYYIGNREEQHYTFAQARLISKSMKQDIVGYELLKNLPGIPAGTKSNEYNGRKAFFTNYTVQYPDLNDTTWFKPICKVKEVVVKISGGREVTVANNNIKMIGGSFDFYHFNSVRDFIINGIMVVNGFTIKHHSVTVGCQEFTKQDVELVYQAIQNYNK